MNQESPNVAEDIVQPSHIKKMIAQAKAENPDSVVVYFIKHKSAPETLLKPKKPLVLFKRSMRVEEVFYALYQQIEVKGLAFFVLKPQKDNMVSYFNLKPGQTIGQVYDTYFFNDYLTLIYNKGPIKRWNFTPAQLRMLRILFILGMVWIIMTVYPMIEDYFYVKPNIEDPIPDPVPLYDQEG